MILSSRQQKMIEACIYENEVNVNLLSKQLNISTRTVFRELKEIEDLIKDYGLVLNTKKQIKIIGEETQINELKKDLYNGQDRFLSKEERQDLLTYEILKSKRLEKIVYYANKFQVSEATISNDLNVVERWLKKQHLQLRRKSGTSIELIGEELQYRKALSLMIGNNITIKMQENIIDKESVLNNIFNKEYESIMQLLNKEVITQILQVFDEYKEPLNLTKYAQTSYIGLIIHLSVAIDRILKNEEIEQNEFAISLMKNEESFKQATLMAQYLECSFQIDIPQQEVAYIAMHIQGAKLNVNQEQVEVDDHMDYDKRLLETVYEIIAAFPTPYPIHKDKELVRSLLVHLKPTLIRIKYDMPIFNPLLEEIKTTYSTLFEATKSVTHIIENEYQVELHDNEIGFMCMHFGAAIERNKQKQIQSVPVKLGVVCSSGIGVSALLCAKIKQISDSKVQVEAYSIQEMIKIENELDVVVSTFDLKAYTNKSIVINPLLRTKDIEQIQIAINKIRMHKNTQQIKQVNDIENIHYISGEMLKLLEGLSVEEVQNTTSSIHLIQQSVSILNVSESIEKNILEALYTRESMETMSYYDLGFALIHTKTSEVDKCIVKVFRLQQPSEEMNSIKFGLLMLMNDHVDSKITKMMGKLSSSLIEDETYYNALKESDYNEVYNQINWKLKEYLSSLL